jgi:transposase
MKLHGNARTCPKSRRLLVERVVSEGWSVTAAAEAAGVSERTVYRWLRRWREEGEVGLFDRSCAPRSIPHRTPPDRVEAIELLRRLFMTAAEIAELLGMALSTVSAVLRRIGLGKRSRLTPPEPPNRYQRKRPGELVHLDIKKLARIAAGVGHRISGQRQSQVANRRARRAGAAKRWEFVHVAVDDATRLAYAEVLADERGQSAAGFLRRAVTWFASFGIAVERVISDNGACYRSDVHALACRELGVARHLFTRPYRPRTNGKAERFIQTLANRWAYGAIYASSAERMAALPGWLTHYG